MEDKFEFIPDKAKTPKGKNSALSKHLTGGWSDYNIVRIERMEIGPLSGWRVTYRE